MEKLQEEIQLLKEQLTKSEENNKAFEKENKRLKEENKILKEHIAKQNSNIVNLGEELLARIEENTDVS